MRIGYRAISVGLALSTLAAVGMAGEVGVGLKAPKLEVAKWFKGKPVQIGDGKMLSVIEFWATW